MWETAENELRYRVRPPSAFRKGTFRSKTLGGGVRLVLAKLADGENKDSMVTQSVRFDKEKWTQATAKTWVAKHEFAEECPETECPNVVEDADALRECALLVEEPGAEPELPLVEMGAEADAKRKAQGARAKKWGIEALPKGHLSPPAGFPDSAGSYADPVNYAYPVHDKAHADNARVRFSAHHDVYKQTKSKRIVYNRIVKAQLKFGSEPSIDPADPLDKLLDASIKARLRRMHNMAEHANDEVEAMRKALHRLRGMDKVSEDDAAFLDECLEALDAGTELDAEHVQRLIGMASTLGTSWPHTSGPAGLASTTSFYAAGASAARAEPPTPPSPQPGTWLATGPAGTYLLNFKDVAKAETYNIPGIEVFKAGVWHGEAWTKADLEQIAKNFQALKGAVQPFVKIGHANAIVANDAEFADDSMPAVGWIDGVRLDGETLVADMTDVPKVVRDLIHKKAYKRVSAEIYTDFVGPDGQHFGKVLRAVALLGAAMPEVKTLRDVALLYKEAPLEPKSEVVHITWKDDDTTGGITVSTPDVEKLQKELSEERERRTAAEAVTRKLQEGQRDAEIARYFSEKVKSGVLVPAQEQMVLGLMKALAISDESLTAEGTKLFSEITSGKGLLGAFKALVETLKPQVDLRESMPLAGLPRQDGSAPGSPPPTPEVKLFTDGLGRTYPIKGFDKMTQAREIMKQNPSMKLEDAVALVERKDKGEVRLFA